MKLLVINGPNINMLGIREPDIYGKKSYADLVEQISQYAKEKSLQVEFFQSNHEGEIVSAIQQAYFDKIDGIIINPAGYTHTSVAILDALKATMIPTVEVHISDVDSREDFRKFSYVKLIAKTTITGQGFNGYLMAIDYLLNLLNYES